MKNTDNGVEKRKGRTDKRIKKRGSGCRKGRDRLIKGVGGRMQMQRQGRG